MTDEELDALVAEKVMGWHQGNHAGVYGQWIDEQGISRHLVYEWRPSDNIDNAFRVVEQIKTRKYGLANNYPNFGIFDETATGGHYWAFFDGWEDDTKYGGVNVRDRAESYSNSLPRAICFAALRLVGAIEDAPNMVVD